MTQVKICGVCRPADAVLASQAGADYVGVILAPERTRTQTLAQAAAIFGRTRARRVGVFVDAGADEIRAAAHRLALDVVQLHGDESAATVRALNDNGLEVWKAIRVRTRDDVVRAADIFGEITAALLLDGFAPHAHGGVGARFDWDAVAAARHDLPASIRVVVAGGLNAENVARVIAVLAPAVVDTSSGVEEEPGVKSATRMQAFIAAARGAKDR